MLYTSGMSFAGALAAGMLGTPAHGVTDLQLLSDKLPSAVLYVAIPSVSLEVTPAIDHALRAAHRQSTTFLGII